MVASSFAAWWAAYGIYAVAATTAAVSTYASYSGAQASAKSQEQAANYNALVALREADASRQAAAYEEDRLREQGEKFKARQRMLFLKGGVDISEGTPLLVEMDTAAQLELDAQAIRWKGEIGAGTATSQAYADLLQAHNAKTIGGYTAGTTLLTGLSSVVGAASGYYKTKGK